MIPTPVTPFEELCQIISNRKIANKITWEEYNEEWAYLMVLCLESMHPKERPLRPAEMDGYETLSKEGKESLGYDGNIKYYFGKLNEYDNEIKTKLMWLREAKSYIPEGDSIAQGKLTEKINEYEGRLHHFGPRSYAA